MPHREGASSWVYSSDRWQAALKVARSEEFEAVLLREAREAVLLASPLLPRVLAVGRAPDTAPQPVRGKVVVAWSWVHGEPANSTVSTDAERLHRALCVARDVGHALHDMHRAGVAHGDVKPENVLFDGTIARLVDFGLMAESWRAVPLGATPRYLPPRPFSGAETAQTRDLWALGRTIAEACCTSDTASSDAAQLPAAVRDIVLALTQDAAPARPLAAWVAAQAERRLAAPGGPVDLAVFSEAQVRRAYLYARRPQLTRMAHGARATLNVTGTPARWLDETLTLLARIDELDPQRVHAPPQELNPLDEHQRNAWLLALIGSAAAAFPRLADSDAELADKLVRLCTSGSPELIRYSDLHTEHPLRPTWDAATPEQLCFELGRGNVDQGLLQAAELRQETAPEQTLSVALGRALRRSGDVPRALSVMDRCGAPLAQLEAAETLRRAGSTEACETLLAAVPSATLTPVERALQHGVAARLALNAGDLERCGELLADQAPSPFLSEVHALLELARENLTGAEAQCTRAHALAVDAEETARAWGLTGMLAHQRSDYPASFRAYERAVENAVRGGSILEEATYLVGLSAACANLGRIEQALDCGKRAITLFAHLNRPDSAARAWLALASAYVLIGASLEVTEASQEALARARAGRDVRCQGYAHTNLAAVAQAGSRDGWDHAVRAAQLMENMSAVDQLLCHASLLRHCPLESLQGAPQQTSGAPTSRAPDSAFDVARGDALAASVGLSRDAAVQWWIERGRRALELGSAEPELRRILDQLSHPAAQASTVSTRGQAHAVAAELSAHLGDGDRTRQHTERAGALAHQLLSHTPREFAGSVNAVGWIKSLRAPSGAQLTPAQLIDVENLVRALGTRDRLAPLLNQVLDALILWTGVERGLLLMKAPNGRLLPRAARNLARADVSGEQLKLSTTLARRALEEGHPVVAVDATNELSDVHESVHLLKLRSVLAVPLLCRGEALGVVYLDDRARAGAFGAAELGWVRVVATLAAVAIADARDQLLLRRAARRAERAENKLSATLATRDAQLHATRRQLDGMLPALKGRYKDIVHESDVMQKTLALVEQVGQTEVPVLIYGESGTGKELVARAIHQVGPRAAGAFVSENCAAIPEPLLESTLFGHTRGAFTGASRPRAGLFEIASGGTLFLDEVGEMSEAMQTKLLRVLESKEIRPLGSESTRRVDVRLITATHRNLKERVAAGKFREDLFYRLHVIEIPLPPLRIRNGDVLPLLAHFFRKHGAGKQLRLSRAAEKLLCAYAWPGNVRQLENEARRLLVTAEELVLPEHLSADIAAPETGANLEHTLNVRRRVDALEADLVSSALERTSGNQTRAAELLGLSRYGLQKMIKRLNIEGNWGRSGQSDE